MVLKSAGVVENCTFRFVHNLVIDFVPRTKDKHRVLPSARAKHLMREGYKNMQIPPFFIRLVVKNVKHFSKFLRGFPPHTLLLALFFRKAKHLCKLRFLLLCCKLFCVLLPFRSSTSHICQWI